MSQVEMLFALAGFCAATAAVEFAIGSTYSGTFARGIAAGMGAVIAVMAILFLVTGVIVLVFP